MALYEPFLRLCTLHKLVHSASRVVSGEALGLCGYFRAGNSGGRSSEHHFWTVSQDPPVSENHGLSPRPPRPRRAAQSGKH